MRWSDEHSRFLVEDLLGVRPERIAALVERIERHYPERERAEAIAKTFVPRAIFSGIPSGLSRSLPSAIAVSLVEQRAAMRQRAMLVAALAYLDDASFFARDDWPRRALELETPEAATDLLLREGARFVGRLVVIRGAARAAAMIPLPLTGWIGGATAALFNAIEMRAFAARVVSLRSAQASAQGELFPVGTETVGTDSGG